MNDDPFRFMGISCAALSIILCLIGIFTGKTGLGIENTLGICLLGIIGAYGFGFENGMKVKKK